MSITPEDLSKHPHSRIDEVVQIEQLELSSLIQLVRDRKLPPTQLPEEIALTIREKELAQEEARLRQAIKEAQQNPVFGKWGYTIVYGYMTANAKVRLIFNSTRYPYQHLEIKVAGVNHHNPKLLIQTLEQRDEEWLKTASPEGASFIQALTESQETRHSLVIASLDPLVHKTSLLNGHSKNICIDKLAEPAIKALTQYLSQQEQSGVFALLLPTGRLADFVDSTLRLGGYKATVTGDIKATKEIINQTKLPEAEKTFVLRMSMGNPLVARIMINLMKKKYERSEVLEQTFKQTLDELGIYANFIDLGRVLNIAAIFRRIDKERIEKSKVPKRTLESLKRLRKKEEMSGNQVVSDIQTLIDLNIVRWSSDSSDKLVMDYHFTAPFREMIYALLDLREKAENQ